MSDIGESCRLGHFGGGATPSSLLSANIDLIDQKALGTSVFGGRNVQCKRVGDMENSRWKAWVELGAALAVFIGLMFVAIEIRQNNDHARADSIRDLFQMWGEIYRFEYENKIPGLVRKSIEDADDISEEEFLMLGKYLDMVMNAQLAQAAMGQEAGLVIGDIVGEAPGFSRLYFSSKASRIWLRNNENWVRTFSPEFYSALTVEIEKNPVATEMPQLEGFDLH